MRRLGVGLRAALFGQLIIASSFAAGQEASTFSLAQVDQAFSAIQTSLTRTADSALTEAESTKPPVDSIVAQQDAGNLNAPDLSRQSQTMTTLLDPLRSVIRPILKHEDVPEELSAVILVESAGNPMALSPKGARGLWQLMPDTARRYGLRVDPVTDERIDIVKSTTAAAEYLHYLYGQFGSWPLALAAYNAGEQCVRRAITRSRSNEFATLSALRLISEETRAYVPAVLAAMGAIPAKAHTSAVAVYALSSTKEMARTDN